MFKWLWSWRKKSRTRSDLKYSGRTQESERGNSESDRQSGYQPPDAAEPCRLESDVIPLEIDGILDLHTFHPREVKALVPDYLEECQNRGLVDVRIIHGKGQGTLRRIVHSILERHPAVAEFRLGGHGSGGWGATSVRLHASRANSDKPPGQ